MESPSLFEKLVFKIQRDYAIEDVENLWHPLRVEEF